MSMKKIDGQLQEKVMGEANAQATDYMYYSKLLQKPFGSLKELQEAIDYMQYCQEKTVINKRKIDNIWEEYWYKWN